jgi:lipoate-protein ligase B
VTLTAPHPEWIGLVPYRVALRYQLLRRDAVIRGVAADAFWLLEHPSVVTLGRRGGAVPSEAWLRGQGTELVATDRGGLATWHGPGQLVGYLMIDTRRLRLRVPAVVEAVEAGLIDALARWHIVADRRQGYPGVWVGDRKIASIGLHVREWVTMHGFALNLCPSLEPFSWIVPCGIVGVGVTSVTRECGEKVSPETESLWVGDRVRAALLDAIVAVG